mmetsp:Transcript_26640/g.41688  ORF Transcript_26640/g.41688 Transcript_26640/m.41688 type:complete len:115 (+) Transcript_26640:2577-2921(+)
MMCREDPSRLTDICRQAIYFQSMSGMLQCLDAILSDTTVQIVRIKNRMSDTYDSMRSGGYRDISLLLKIDTQETRTLGIAEHIAELQLCHVLIAERKNCEGHARYRDFRDMRGE